MTKFRNVFAAIILVQTAAFAADQGLLKLVMPDVKVIAGIQVNQAKLSPFGRFILSHMQPDDPGFLQFVKETNFDPRRDLTEIVMASSSQADLSGRWLILARGAFDPRAILRAAQQNGGVATPFQGVDIISGEVHAKNSSDSVIAFPDNSSAIIGDPDSVKAAIQRYQNKPVALASLIEKVGTVSAKYDFWFTTLVPVSEFAGSMPDPNLGQAMKGNVLEAIIQATGGVKFTDPVQVSAEAITRSDKDATALVDVARFIGSMIQMNRQKSATAAQVSSLVDNLQLNAAGTTFTLSLTIPESQLEDLFQATRVEKHVARK